MFLASYVRADENTREAPSVELKGVVVDEKGRALPGASVWVKGTVVGAGQTRTGNSLLS